MRCYLIPSQDTKAKALLFSGLQRSDGGDWDRTKTEILVSNVSSLPCKQSTFPAEVCQPCWCIDQGGIEKVRPNDL